MATSFDGRPSNSGSTQNAVEQTKQQIAELMRSGDPYSLRIAEGLKSQLETMVGGRGGYYADPLAGVTGDVNRQIGNDYNQFQEQSAFDEVQGRSRELIGGAKGLYDQAMNDPTDRFIMERLRDMSDPTKVQDALFTQGADQATAASGARWNEQQNSLAMRGLTPQSGAFQAAQNQNMAQRQQDVQRARLNSTLAGQQQASQALSQMGNQQQAQFGRKQGAFGTYGEALKTPVGVRPQGQTGSTQQPNVNQGTGATFKPISYADFQGEWAKANAPKPKTSWF
jgi:hypothetical protein